MFLNPGTSQNLDWLYEIRNGRAFSDTVSVAASVGNFSALQLMNPAGSGKTALVRMVLGMTPTTQRLSVRFHNTALTTDDGAGVNLLSGAPDGVCHLRSENPAALPGTIILYALALATTVITFAGEWVCILGEGEGLVLGGHTVNTEVAGTFQWVEL